MKEVVLISGKGGTGKTSLAASLAALAGGAVMADCDVDAADLHLVMRPVTKETGDFTGGKQAGIVPALCSNCGKCHELCRFGAVIKKTGEYPSYKIDPVACEGCGVCSYFCPEKAIAFEPVVNGQWFVSGTPYGPMVHARLGIAGENSGKLVSLVRSRARSIAGREGLPYIIADGPPGTGCPVIASITGADMVVIVSEPTVSGGHDMERVAELAAYFKIPAYLCMNKYDLNPQMADRIRDKAKSKGVADLGSIPYDRAVTDAQLQGVPVVLLGDTEAAKEVKKLWRHILHRLRQEG